MSKRRPPDDEGQRLWRLVASTVTGRAPEKALKMRDKARIRPGKAELMAHAADVEPPTHLASVAPLRIDPADIPALKPKPAPKPPPEGIEPNRRRRIAKAHDPIGARLDMHGLDQDQARATLERFIRRAFDDGHRAVLVITGKGKVGHGVLRQRTPEWLADPALREMIAGVSQADQRHGGEGALYVALKRKG
ncbi:Smr/MutS family protein [Caulobacter sp. CCNWLY153]|uniref:DNA mismatch repair protein MutS n=1 Tax=Caulobacter radicis TaxID=2172650 RepID=A0A2T9J1G6_9CAUL|nr:Smr/MutS family protein [Caulobacter radicis]PVM73919.1 DNA mismatch repair protein MutS [Caulobacter radicis]PVM84953.1 DNA mismatch repair protein MutS [Caulobacter radicis]